VCETVYTSRVSNNSISAPPVANFDTPAAAALPRSRGGASKIDAVPENIKRDQGKRNDRRKYGDHRRPIDVLFRATAKRRNRRQGFESDFPHLARRSAPRVIDCAAKPSIFPRRCDVFLQPGGFPMLLLPRILGEVRRGWITVYISLSSWPEIFRMSRVGKEWLA